MEPFRPLVDLYTASCVSGGADKLTLKVKQHLFNLTNYLVLQDGRRFRMISAIGRLAESYSQIVQGEDCSLALPELLPLESYQYA